MVRARHGSEGERGHAQVQQGGGDVECLLRRQGGEGQGLEDGGVGVEAGCEDGHGGEDVPAVVVEVLPFQGEAGVGAVRAGVGAAAGG